MSNTKTTKRALLSSVMAMLICVAILIGTTFAWFTDSASTAVNKIQAGTLDIALEMKTTDGTWVPAEGKTLSWKKAVGAPADEQVLWEPGCTYELPELRIVNNGTLALKYKIIVNGIVGDAKLLEAIVFTYGDDIDIDAEVSLAPNATTEGIVIKGHMKDEAGNEYQGLSIDGIGITVIATQDTVEYDSNNNQYDEHAVYPVAPTLSNTTVAGTIKSAEQTTLGKMTNTASPTAAEITIPAGAVADDTNAVFTMNLTDLSPDSVTYEISLKEAGTDTPVTLSSPAKVTTNIGANLTNVVVKHSGAAMTKVTNASQLADGKYYYNKSTGELIICTSTFSPFEISYEFNGAASVNGTAYSTLASAIAAAKDGDTVVLMKNYVDKTLVLQDIDKKLTLDLNGNEIEYQAWRGSNKSAVQISNVKDLTIKNGTISSQTAWAIYMYGNNNNLTVDNAVIKAPFSGSTAILSYSTNSTLKITDSNISATNYGITQNGTYSGNKFEINKTSITAQDGCAVYISNTANKDKQSITIDMCTISGSSAVEVKHTNATITSSTLIGTTTPATSKSSGNGPCTDGYAFAVTTNSATDLVTGNVTVSNCKFYSGSTTEGESNGYVFVYQVADGSSVTIDGTAVTDYNTYGGEVNEGGSED